MFDLSTMYSTWLWIAEDPAESLVIGANAMLSMRSFTILLDLFSMLKSNLTDRAFLASLSTCVP